MGRIDDALNRAAATDPALAPSPIPADGDVFVSPWSVAPVRDIASARPAPAQAPSPVAAPALAPGWVENAERIRFSGFSPELADRLTLPTNTNWRLVEQFRSLAGNLHHAQTTGDLKTVMVTSAEPGDGKTLTALNLALVFSESYGRKVLLIDADLRRPALQMLARLGTVSGLSEALKSDRDEKLSVYQLSQNLTLLPAGRPDPDPTKGLSSYRMKRIIDEARSRFDWIIVDAPPVGVVVDASLLLEMVQTALLVVRAEKTQSSHVRRAIESLGRDRVFGVVLNAVSDDATGTDNRYYSDNYNAPDGAKG